MSGYRQRDAGGPARRRGGRAPEGENDWRQAQGGYPSGRPCYPAPRSAARSGRGWWRRLSRRARWGYGSAIAVTVLAVLTSVGGYALYAHLDGNLTVVNAFGGLRHRPPRSAPGVLNILVLGSQTRDGQGPGFGYDPGTNLSDNLLLVHLDATHTHAIVVSIPRDTLVYEPACKSRLGNSTVPAIPGAIIDGAMNQGGPACAVATVEYLTHIRMDHFVEFDFNSFRAMVDTLGGVEVCVPPGGYVDPWSKLSISGGEHLVTGNEALAFVRTRHGVGDGGDLGRIELQQEFISSLIQKLESQGTLDDPAKLLEIANTATHALTVDPGLGSIAKLLSLADTMRNLHTRNVTFVTMPTVADPANLNRLLPQEPQDDVIWQMLRTGTPWNGQLSGTVASKVRVSVLNGTGVARLAGQAARRLRKLGFDVIHVGDTSPTSYTTVTYLDRAQAGSAYTLMDALNQAPATQNGVSGPVTLTIGSDFAGVRLARHHHGKHASTQPAGTPAASASTPAASTSTPAASTSTPAAGAGTPAASTSSAPAVETRNAAASICSDMPAANPDVGTPP